MYIFSEVQKKRYFSYERERESTSNEVFRSRVYLSNIHKWYKILVGFSKRSDILVVN